MQKLTKTNIALLFMLLFSVQAFANDDMQPLPSLNNVMFADAEACRSCVDEAGCDRINRECHVLCQSNISTSEEEAKECGISCAADWSGCNAKAKAACTYDCKKDS